MSAILGIDAAWTDRHPSGVALVRKDQAGWRCVGVAPSYDAFLALAAGRTLDWNARAEGSPPKPAALLQSAEALLGGDRVTLVTIDMPVSLGPIVGRRAADSEVAKHFGRHGCSTHSPTRQRPAGLSTRIRAGFAHAGFPLATTATRARTSRRLLEVYPHPALLRLLNESFRVKYKVSRATAYWPHASRIVRASNILQALHRILTALQTQFPGVSIPLPEPGAHVQAASLKRYEDALDALVCAWAGTMYLAGAATPYGDERGAVWIP